jgi:hypothetical protein
MNSNNRGAVKSALFRGCLTLLAFLGVQTSDAQTPPELTIGAQRVVWNTTTRTAAASVCDWATPSSPPCTNIVATAHYDEKGAYVNTELYIRETDGGYALDRYLICTIFDKHALEMSPEFARLGPAVMDASSPSCTTWGYRQEIVCDEDGENCWGWFNDNYVFEGTYTLEAYRKDPTALTKSESSNHTYDFYYTPTMRWDNKCQSYSAQSVRSGWFTINGNYKAMTYDSSFPYQDCTNVTK